MTEIVAGREGPHADSPVHAAGTPLEEATAAVLAFHGRGATPASVLGIAREVDVDGVAYLAPAASRNTWYPRSFTEPLDANEPHLGSALDLADDLVGRAADRVGRERVALLGFSQGACLAGEYVARNAARYGGLAVLSGGLVGPEDTPRDYDGSLSGTPAFVGCSDVDPHIPLERVRETTETLRSLDAEVTERVYEGMGHTVNRDEIDRVETLIDGIVG
ncbi:phospholipase [Halobacteriales archaeon SW_12_71_31]|nr:MAG: phospholipase [Halobacteriales archaeon SW_12_71_31]